jgi:hypothetical protein
MRGRTTTVFNPRDQARMLQYICIRGGGSAIHARFAAATRVI